MLVLYHSWSICHVHGSYDSNLGSEILSLGGDISSRSWLNIDDSYGSLNAQVEIQISNLLYYKLAETLCQFTFII